MKYSIGQIQSNLAEALATIRQFDWLIDSYVLDFYADDHWDRMPATWATLFGSIEPEQLAPLLSHTAGSTVVWPLSILAIRALVEKLNVPRQEAIIHASVERTTPEMSTIYTNPKIRNIVAKKNIKQKKRHEIEKMGEVTARVAVDCGIEYIIDFGSGLGHLSRTLAYGYGLNVCCLEQQTTLSDQAAVLDARLEQVATKLIKAEDLPAFRRPVHLNICLTRETDLRQLVRDIMNIFEVPAHLESDFEFGIIGLHPCGDLAAMLMNFFLRCFEARFVNLVGCCYMKLSCPPPQQDAPLVFRGYPLSDYLMHHRLAVGAHLSYEAREIACHAIEQYESRLRAGNFEYLRVHSYRAAIEKIICNHWPHLRHSGLRSIKHLTTFQAYCKDAVSHLGIAIPDEDIHAKETEENVSNWKRVVIFYTLRLMFAPLVESVILYDRLLYSLECGCDTNLRAIFNPEISPRNHILTAIKS